MATAEGRGKAKASATPTTTASASASSYGGGGGGAGGKFRKKPFRRQTTPYERPLTAVHGKDGNSAGWLTKLVVDPASKLISYGAQRFFASVFRKRLSPPPPPQPPEMDHDLSKGLQAEDENGAQEQGVDECLQQVNILHSSGISELEQLLKQKTFTKSEIEHLTALLHSRTVDVSVVYEGRRNEETLPHFGKSQELAIGSVELNRNEKTPVVNRTALEDEIASPAELAKAYMGSRPSKVSPSMLAMRSQVGREETVVFASKLPILPLPSSSFGKGSLENGLLTPKSQGRLGILNKSRTPSSRIHPTSILKENGIDIKGYASQPMSSPLSLVKHEENFEIKPMMLKRRSSVLDDAVGSVGPIRRIKQKPNLLASDIPCTPHRVGSHSTASQNLPFERKNKAPVTVGENENESVPSTSYARVPSKSREVAARILQHLEMLTPSEKSSASKSVDVQEKSPFKLTPSMPCGRAPRSMEDMGSLKLPAVLDNKKLEERSDATFRNASDSTSQERGKLRENGPIEYGGPSGTQSSLSHNDAKLFLEPSGRRFPLIDSVMTNSVAQPSQKRAFRMSAQEDSMDQDDDIRCNGFAPPTFSEGKVSTELAFTGQILQSAEETNFTETTTVREVKSVSVPVLSRPDGLVTAEVYNVGVGTTEISPSMSEKANAVPKTIIRPLSATAEFGKPKESDILPAFVVNSKVTDKFPFVPLESSREKLESTPNSSCGLVSVSSPAVSLLIPEPDESVLLNPSEPGNGNGMSNAVPSAASNGPLATSSPSSSFTAASYKDTTQSSTSIDTRSTFFGIANITPSISNTGSFSSSTGSRLGSTMASSTIAGPVFKVGAGTDQSPSVSAVSTAKMSESAKITKDEFNPSSGSLGGANSSVAASISASTGNSTMALGSSSDVNNLRQNSLVAAAKSFMFNVGTDSQGTSSQASSAASFQSFSMNGSVAFGSSLSNSQMFNPSKPLGFSMAASSSAASTIFSNSGSTLDAGSLGASSASAPVSSSSSTSPGAFNLGLSSSSTFANAVGPSSSAAVFSFTSSSLTSAPVPNSAISLSSSTNGLFGFSASSIPSPASSSFSSSGASSNAFSSSWGAPTSSAFGSSASFPSSSAAFSFSASSSAPSNAPSMVFNPSAGALPGPSFSFTSATASVSSSGPPSFNLPMFGNPSSSFPVSSGISYQANAEDSMAEDTVPSSAPSFPVPVFGQSTAAPSPSYVFGSTTSQSSIPFQFGSQQTQVALPNSSPFQSSQVAPPNPSPFQSSGSFEFPGGGFSLGSGDKSGRKFVKVNRNKNRKR